MSNDFQGNINIGTNFPSVVRQIVGSIKRLESGLDDLVGLFEDLGRVQQQYVKSTEDTAKVSKDAARSVKDLNNSLSGNAVKGSTRFLDGYVKTVNDLRTALGKGVKPTNLFPDTSAASAEIKELENELLNLVNVYRTSLGRGELLREAFTTEGAIAELNNLRLEFENLYKSALTGQGIDFTGATEELQNFKNALADVNKEATQLSPAQKALTQFDELRSRGNDLVSDVRRLQDELVDVGPAAVQGNEQAIQKFGELTQRLRDTQKEAAQVGENLRLAQGQLQRELVLPNFGLEQLGFRPIKVEDIFPTAEQQRYLQVQERIRRATFESAQEGAVRNALNFFLNANSQLEQVDKNIINLTSHFPRLRYALYDVSQTASVLGGSLIGIGAGIFKVAADFERAFADVERTVFDGVNKSASEVERLRNELIDLSTTIPVTFKDLAEIATLAGQLNIASESVANFTETVAKFAATTDVTIEAAATAFGRLDQLVFGVNGQFDRLASSILAVGVRSVATESDIIKIATQISSIANIAGVSADELIGFSSALASVGTRPELSRGTFTRLFTEINTAVAEGGEQLDNFARIAGTSADDLASAWGAGSGTEVIVSILRGLSTQGQEAERSLASIGITSVRDVPTLLKLAQSIEDVERQLRVAKIGFIEGTELQNQYSVISATLTERLKVLSNSFQSLINTLADSDIVVGSLVDALSLLLRGIEKVIDNPLTGTFFATASVLSIVAGALALTAGGFTRLGGSFVGALTSAIELNTVISITALSLNNLNTLNGNVTTSTTAAAGSFELLTQQVREAAAALFGFNAAQAGVQAGAGATGAALTGVGSALFNVGKSTKFISILSKVGFWGAIISSAIALIGVVDALGESFGFWGDKIDEFNAKIGDISPYLEAVRQDTQDFRDGIQTSADGVILFTGEVDKAGESLSNRGKLIAAASGEEELLRQSVDSTSDAFDRQTLAIGKNTRALLSQRLAESIATAAEQPSGFDTAVDFTVASISGTSDLFVREREQRAALQSLIDILGTDLSDALAEAGFSYKEFNDAITSGNQQLALSIAENLGPAAQQVRDAFAAEDAQGFANEIALLNPLVDRGSEALASFVTQGSEVQDILRQVRFQMEMTGDSILDVAEETETWRDLMIAAANDLYAPINAQRDAEQAIRELGAAFAEEGAQITATSQEVQDAILAIINAADSEEDAIAGLQGFYAAIVDGGYLAKEELATLAEQIISTYRTAALAQIQLLRDQRTANVNAPRQTGVARRQRQLIDQQIAEQERALKNIENIGRETGRSAEYANLLADGYSSVRKEAGGAAREVEDVAEETREAVKEVRTLIDYAGDLRQVINRAFDIRFSAGLQIDQIAASWEDLTNRVEEARREIDDLIQSQQDLAADRAIKQYFLSVAESYGDMLRAAKLRSELAELDKQQAENAEQLRRAEEITGSSLVGAGEVPRENRRALLDLVAEYQQYITTLAESGASQDELRAATTKARQEFIQQATELGFQREVVLQYAQAFDDVTTAIDNVPRNITVDANVNPALQALNELNARLVDNINAAARLNEVLADRSQIRPNVPQRQDVEQVSATLFRSSGGGLLNVGIFGQRARKLFASGGYTGAGGKYEPAGIVHRGEYVVPKQYVNQSTGLPSAAFLAQLQNGMRGYANGGFVSGGGMSEGPIMVELSPYDRKLLQDAGNVQLRVNGRVLAETTNASNYDQARRGSN